MLTISETISLLLFFKEVRKINKKNSDNKINHNLSVHDKNELILKQENELVLKAQSGDKKAIEQLLNNYLMFIIKTSKKYQAIENIEDIIQEQSLGFLEALPKYNITGNRYFTHAVHYMKLNTTNYLNDHSCSIRIPWNKRRELEKINKFKTKFHKENERMPTEYEIENAVGLVGENINVNSIDVPLSWNGDDLFLSDILTDDDDNSIFREVSNEDNIKKELLTYIEPIEYEILKFMILSSNKIEDRFTVSSLLNNKYNTEVFTPTKVSKHFKSALLKLKNNETFILLLKEKNIL